MMILKSADPFKNAFFYNYITETGRQTRLILNFINDLCMKWSYT